jgi:hypothetical protein
MGQDCINIAQQFTTKEAVGRNLSLFKTMAHHALQLMWMRRR